MKLHISIGDDNGIVSHDAEVEIPILKLTVPAVGQKIKIVQPDDNGLGGQAIKPGMTGYVDIVKKLHNGGYEIGISLDQTNYVDGDPPSKEENLEAWCWGWNDNYDPCIHPNGFEIPALAAFHFHCLYVDNCYNDKQEMTDEYIPIFD